MVNKAVDHGQIYDFVRDLRHDDQYPFIHCVEEYKNQKVIKWCPTQHQNITPYKQKMIIKQWVHMLTSTDTALIEVQVCTKIDQKLFDALCHQKNIESLRIKWFSGNDLSSISHLKRLKHLFIENAPSITNITPISTLIHLETLILGSSVKVYDYDCIANNKKLKVLGICSYQTKINERIKMKSDEFIKELTQLEYLDLIDCDIDEHLCKEYSK